MKKVTMILGVAFLAAVLLSSCKKEYTCECTYNNGSTSMTTSTVIKDTKKNAEDACSALEIGIVGTTYVWSCEIK